MGWGLGLGSWNEVMTKSFAERIGKCLSRSRTSLNRFEGRSMTEVKAH